MTSRNALLATTALCASITLATTASADSEVRLRPGMMGVADIGAHTCETFNAMHYHGPSGMEHHVLTWAQGYVFARTGSNIDAMLVAIDDGDNGWTFDTLTRVFVDYCKANPEAPVSAAVVALWTALSNGETAPAE